MKRNQILRFTQVVLGSGQMKWSTQVEATGGPPLIFGCATGTRGFDEGKCHFGSLFVRRNCFYVSVAGTFRSRSVSPNWKTGPGERVKCVFQCTQYKEKKTRHSLGLVFKSWPGKWKNFRLPTKAKAANTQVQWPYLFRIFYSLSRSLALWVKLFLVHNCDVW